MDTDTSGASTYSIRGYLYNTVSSIAPLVPTIL